MVVSRPPRRSCDGGEGWLRISTLVSRVLSLARLGASPRRWRAIVRPFDERGYLRSSRPLAVGKLHDSTARAAPGRKPRAFRGGARRGRTELDQRVRRERVAQSRSRGSGGPGKPSDGRGKPGDTRHIGDVTRPRGLRARLAGLRAGRVRSGGSRPHRRATEAHFRRADAEVPNQVGYAPGGIRTRVGGFPQRPPRTFRRPSILDRTRLREQPGPLVVGALEVFRRSRPRRSAPVPWRAHAPRGHCPRFRGSRT